MQITTKYDLWDEVETLLGDIGIIIEIIIQSERVRYTVWHSSDKYVQLSENQFKLKQKAKL